MRRTWVTELSVKLRFALAIALVFGAVATGTTACSSEPTVDSQSGEQTADAASGEGGGGEGGAGSPDGGSSDASSTTDGTSAAGDILGTLASGACGIVKSEITQPSPSLENNLLVFVAGETYAKSSLSPDGQRLFDTPNAGGSSGESEIMSFEVLHHCEGASLLKTETEIGYTPPDASGSNSITDILVEIAGKKVGVSVTRAYKPPTQPAMTDAEVKALLEKKLDGINASSLRVLPADKWVKQILHVFSVNKAMTDAIGRVWATIDALTRADTIVLVTQTTGGGFVYCANQSPPLGAECQ
jgi:hypothetical protein